LVKTITIIFFKITSIQKLSKIFFIKPFLTLIIFLTANVFLAQEQDTISRDVISFWNIVNENAKFAEKKESIKKQYTNEEIKDIATKLYKATEKDPFGFHSYIIKAHKKYVENVKSDNSLIAPSPKLHMLITDINKIYGDKFGEIIETPFFIRR
jgi:hypothetical protein